VGTFLNDCLSVLLVLIVPWSAINLADFYLVRRGHYSIEDMFTPHGRYGLVSARGYAAYFITLVCEIPFLHVLSFEGPVASALGGGDISFVVGIVLGVSLYWALMRTKVSRETITPEEATSKVELA
jgi:purine-cytosine permease-like protein